MGGYPCCCDGGGGGTTFASCAAALSSLLSDYPYSQTYLSSISVLDASGCPNPADDPPDCASLSTGPYNSIAAAGNGYYGNGTQTTTLCADAVDYQIAVIFNCSTGGIQCTLQNNGSGSPGVAAYHGTTGNDIKTMIEDWYNNGTPFQFIMDDPLFGSDQPCQATATVTPLATAP